LTQTTHNWNVYTLISIWVSSKKKKKRFACACACATIGTPRPLLSVY